LRRWSAARSRILEVLEVFALASFTASVALAFFERYVAAVVALLAGIAVLSYISTVGGRSEG
jgi:Mg/Co/Ni transporter MgtE